MSRKVARTILLLAPGLILIGFLFLFPLFGILKLSLFNPGFTTASFEKLVASPVALLVMERTFTLALTVTALSVVTGYPIAYYLATSSPRWRTILVYLILLPFWTSILIRTYTWMVVLGREGLVNSVLQWTGLTDGPTQLLFTGLAVHLAMVQILMPIVIITCYSTMIEIDEGLIRAARTLGATPGQAFAKVFLPLSLPGVATGAAMCFILSLGFYITPALLGGRRNVMLSNLIDFEVHQTLNWSFASVLALVLLAATLVALGLFRLVAPRRRDQG